MTTIKLPVIGIAGRANAGKSTVCEMAVRLMKIHARTATTVALADPLKRACADIYSRAYGIEAKHFFGTQNDKSELLPVLDGWTGSGWFFSSWVPKKRRT